MGKKLPHAPIFQVLAQVRFATLPKLNEHIADVQEDLRNNGFPDPFEEKITEFQFNMTGAQPAVEPREIRRWVSRNAKATAGFIFDPGSITYQDRKSTRLNSSHIQKSRMPSSA